MEASSTGLRPPGRWEYLTLALLLFLGGLRFLSLGKESFWLDEAKAAGLALAPISFWWTDLPHHHTPPGHFLILKGVSWISTSDAALRFPSAAGGLLSILVLWRIARTVLSPVGAAAAAGLWTICPVAWCYSQEARPYALWVLAELCALSVLVRGPTTWDRRTSSLLAGVLQTAPLLLHYNALLFLLGRIPLWIRFGAGLDRTGRSWFISGAAAALLVSVPWWLNQFLAMPPENPRVHTAWTELTPALATRLLGDLFGLEYPFRWLAWILLLGGLSGAGVLLAGGIRTGMLSPSLQRSFAAALVVPGLLVPLVLIETDRYIAARHALPLVPLLLMTWLMGVERLTAGLSDQQRRLALAAGACLPGALWGYAAFSRPEIPDRPPWREVAEYLESAVPEGSACLAAGDNVSVLEYYRQTRIGPYVLYLDGDGPPFERMPGPDESGPGRGLPPDRDARVLGMVIAGDEDGGVEYRGLLSAHGIKPARTWTSRRIARIEYYDLRGIDADPLLQNPK